jgi:uncharacterized protein
MHRKEHAFIEVADGARLAASLFLPEGDGPWAPLLEALPYRKDDITSSYGSEYARLADAGYAVCRVDVRGTGSSEGIAQDEYPPVERSDLVTVIDWLASREWSTGNVGMYGTSYSGFNAIQIAMERPQALKAVIPIFATDDRYADDVHYVGGVLKQLDLVDYPAYMVAMNALPPVPSVFGLNWRDEWERRVKQTEPWLLTWLEHQRYDDYWRFGSLREDYGAIGAATMIVAGWADGYTNNSLRTFERLSCPKKVLIGPWSHGSVETCLPGPNIDLVPLMVRWWDRWLRGIDNGVDREPPITLYAQRSTRPSATRTTVNGAWRFEPTWPAERLAPTPYALGDARPGGVAHGHGPNDVVHVRGDVGVTAWISCAASMPWGQPQDQRPDEAASLTYTWGPFQHDLEILGHPRLRARVASSASIAFLSAKLCDVFPDGTSGLITRGILNLTHRGSRETPVPLEPDRAEDVDLELDVCSWTFVAGHSLRLALAGTDWPNAWPPPEPLTLTVDRRGTSLTLPVMQGASPVEERPSVPPPGQPQSVVSAADTDPNDGWVSWRVVEDIVGRERRAVAVSRGAADADGDVPASLERYGGTVGVSLDDPGGAFAEADSRFELRFPEATCSAEALVRVASDRSAYTVTIDLVVEEDGRERWRRSWNASVPRDGQ